MPSHGEIAALLLSSFLLPRLMHSTFRPLLLAIPKRLKMRGHLVEFRVGFLLIRWKDDELQVKVNKLLSTKTQLPYESYCLDYCKPSKIVNSAENLGGSSSKSLKMKAASSLSHETFP